MLKKVNNGGQEIREDCNDNTGHYNERHIFPQHRIFYTLLFEFLGCVIGSFLGTVFVKILVQFL